jgi:hypothetical protein
MATTSKKTSGSIKTGFSGFGSNVVKSNKANNAKQASTPAFSGAVSSAFKTGATKLTDKGSGGLQSKARDEAIRRSGGGGSVKKAESGTLSSSIISPTNFAAQTQSIGVSDLGSISSPISLPTPPKIADYGSTIQSNNIALGADQAGLFQQQEFSQDGAMPSAATPMTAGESILQKFGLQVPEQPESSLDAYLKAQRAFDIKKKQQQVTNYQAQLNAVVAKSQADQLSVTGQGRGIPEVIIGGQQAQIAKEAAIAALPIQAQLAAAQGDLEFAQQNMNTYLDLAQKDIENKFNYKMKLFDVAYDIASKDQQAKLDEKRDTLAYQRQKELAQINFNYDRSLKQMGLAADFQKDLIAQTQAQQAAQSEALNGYQVVNNVLNSGQVENVFGLNRLNPFNYIPGTKVQYAKNQVNQIKSMLSLENREKLKGSGAISDFEAKMLGQAASSLGTNISNADALRELKKIRGAFANAAGQPAMVKITDPTNGRSVTVAATRDVVNQAIIDGAQVEYQ